jgi:hypothetical protein
MGELLHFIDCVRMPGGFRDTDVAVTARAAHLQRVCNGFPLQQT